MSTGLVILLIAAFGVVIVVLSSSPIGRTRNDEAGERQEAKRAVAKVRDQWLDALRPGLQFCTEGTLVGHEHAGNCVLGFDPEQQALKLFGYTTSDEFKVQVEANIPLAQVLSLEIVRPMELKNVKRVQAVGMVSTNKKSPVARGLVGGAVLGPAGLVLGAASGASKDVSTKIEEHSVWEQVQREGDPQLHIGTSDPESPLVRFKPDNGIQAEEWQHRIRALQTQTTNSES